MIRIGKKNEEGWISIGVAGSDRAPNLASNRYVPLQLRRMTFVSAEEGR
jgi:hypothetical protein